MDTDRPPQLRTPGTKPGAVTPPGGSGIGGPPPPINALAELVADLIAATGLVPADKLAGVRSAAGMRLVRRRPRRSERGLERGPGPNARGTLPDAARRPRPAGGLGRRERGEIADAASSSTWSRSRMPSTTEH